MIYEFRSYRLRPGAAPAYLGMLAREGLPHVTRHLPLLGYWLTETGRLNMIHHLWAYADWEERTAARAGLAGEAAWTEEFIPVAFQWVEEQENMFLDPVRKDARFDAVVAARRSLHPARPAQEPLFVAEVAALSFSEHGVAGPVMAEFAIRSGFHAGWRVALHHRSAAPDAAEAGVSRHEIIRPLAFSPL